VVFHLGLALRKFRLKLFVSQLGLPQFKLLLRGLQFLVDTLAFASWF
jgi:hypothetical protein